MSHHSFEEVDNYVHSMIIVLYANRLLINSNILLLWQGTRCLSGTRKEGERGNFSDTVGFMTNNIMLIVQVMGCKMKPCVCVYRGVVQGERREACAWRGISLAAIRVVVPPNQSAIYLRNTGGNVCGEVVLLA